MDDRLTTEEVNQKVEQLKENFKRNTLKKAFVQNSIYTDQQIQQHKSKKAKARKQSKLQKASRKKNRG